MQFEECRSPCKQVLLRPFLNRGQKHHKSPWLRIQNATCASSLRRPDLEMILRVLVSCSRALVFQRNRQGVQSANLKIGDLPAKARRATPLPPSIIFPAGRANSRALHPLPCGSNSIQPFSMLRPPTIVKSTAQTDPPKPLHLCIKDEHRKLRTRPPLTFVRCHPRRAQES